MEMDEQKMKAEATYALLASLDDLIWRKVRFI